MAKGKLEKILGRTFIWVNLLALTVGVLGVYKSTLGDASLIYENQQNFTYDLEPFSTNLEGKSHQFIRLAVSLEMFDEKSVEEVGGLHGVVRDSVIRILNSKSFYELETVQGKLRLKNQIISRINHFLHRGVVQNVYFSDFAVQ